MKDFLVVDPDWDDATPVLIEADDAADAVRNFYRETLFEEPPELYASEAIEAAGSGTFASIGDVRVVQFYVTDEHGTKYDVFFE